MLTFELLEPLARQIDCDSISHITVAHQLILSNITAGIRKESFTKSRRLDLNGAKILVRVKDLWQINPYVFRIQIKILVLWFLGKERSHIEERCVYRSWNYIDSHNFRNRTITS